MRGEFQGPGIPMGFSMRWDSWNAQGEDGMKLSSIMARLDRSCFSPLRGDIPFRP